MIPDFVDPFSTGSVPDPIEDDLSHLDFTVPDKLPPEQALNDAIWALSSDGPNHGLVADARLLGYVVLAEFVSPQGRILRYMSGDGSGGPIPTWQSKGYVHDYLDEMRDHAITFNAESDESGDD